MEIAVVCLDGGVALSWDWQVETTEVVVEDGIGSTWVEEAVPLLLLLLLEVIKLEVEDVKVT